jgi:hypothetical protein
VTGLPLRTARIDQAERVGLGLAGKSGGHPIFLETTALFAARMQSRVGIIKKILGGGFCGEISMAPNRENPRLTMTDATSIPILPPRKLGEHGLALWNSVQTTYHVDDAGGVELLAQACAAADRVEALAERINADGEVVQTRTGPKAHPALRDELAGRAFICRTLERLGLNVETIKPIGRPSSAGWRGRDAD